MIKYGSEFKHIFEEAQQHTDYWMEDLRLQFLNGILALMEEQGFSQKSLAEVMGVSEAYISRVFNDNVEKNFTLKTLVELSRAVNAEIKISVVPREKQVSVSKVQEDSFTRFFNGGAEEQSPVCSFENENNMAYPLESQLNEEPVAA